MNPLPSPQVIKKDTEEMMDVIATTIKAKSSEIPPVTPTPNKREQKEMINETLNLASSFVSIMQNANAIEAQNKIATQEELYRKGKISEEQYQKAIGRIKRQQAEQDKEYAIFQIIINTAQAAMATAGRLGFPAAIPFIAAVAALGAAQVVAVQNQPLPKQQEGNTLRRWG